MDIRPSPHRACGIPRTGSIDTNRCAEGIGLAASDGLGGA
jgi:hypothetical protein